MKYFFEPCKTIQLRKMTKRCVVCKKQPIPMDNSRAFYKFPKNENLRKRWMEILNVPAVTSNMSVCSDHFDDRSFEESDGHFVARRLHANAVPTEVENQVVDNKLLTKKVFANVTNCINIANNNDYSAELLRNDEHNYSKRRDAIEDTIVSTQNLTISCSNVNQLHYTRDLGQLLRSKCVPTTENSEVIVETNNKCHSGKVIDQNVNELLQCSIVCENPNWLEDIIKSEDQQCFIEYTYELSPNVKSSPNENDVEHQESLCKEAGMAEKNVSKSPKRKRSLHNVPPTKKFRFVTELQTEHISREDFVSNEAWERFVRLMITHKTQIESANKKNLQQQKKIDCLEKLVSMLTKNDKKNE